MLFFQLFWTCSIFKVYFTLRALLNQLGLLNRCGKYSYYKNFSFRMPKKACKITMTSVLLKSEVFLLRNDVLQCNS